MEEKLLHPDKVLDDLGTDVVVDRLILASLHSFSFLCFPRFDHLPGSLPGPLNPTPKVWVRPQV